MEVREPLYREIADLVINTLLSNEGGTDVLLEALERDRGGFNCVYLGPEGCLWKLKPIVCEMFLCDEARESLLGPDPSPARRWEELRRMERDFTRPTRPVLFDDLESLFLEAGFDSPLMYFHRSPGLRRLKARHGLDSSPSARARLLLD